MSSNIFNNLVNSPNISSIITENISSANFFSDFDKDFFSTIDEQVRQSTNQFIVETENMTDLILSSQSDNARTIMSLLGEQILDEEQTHINDSLYEATSFKKLISDDGKKQLEKIKFSNTEKNKCCPITFEEFNDGDDIIRLPCQHCFQPEAIERWVTHEKAECPVCRFPLDYTEIRVQNSG